MRIILILLIASLFGCSPIEKRNSLKERQNLPLNMSKTNDPIFYNGSSFGEYFQILSRTGRYVEMLNLTSKNDRVRFGDSCILMIYKELKFSFPLRLKAYVKENDTIWLIYETSINATRSTVRFPIVLENDSCRLLLSEFHNP